MFYTKSLHPKCPTTLLWVETLFYLCCVGTGTGQLPPVHTNYSDTSEAWIGNSVLMVYKKVYNVSRKYQENWNKEHPINNQQKSHPFNVSDKYHVCLGSSTIKTDLQAMKQESCSRKSAIKHYHHQGETWKPKYQILKKFVGVKWPAEITLTLR